MSHNRENTYNEPNNKDHYKYVLLSTQVTYIGKNSYTKTKIKLIGWMQIRYKHNFFPAKYCNY